MESLEEIFSSLALPSVKQLLKLALVKDPGSKNKAVEALVRHCRQNQRSLFVGQKSPLQVLAER